MIAALTNHLWQSTLFAAAVALLALALRNNRAQTRYLLWLTASLKFLVPFSVFVALGSHFGPIVSAPIAHSAFPAVSEIGKPFVALPVFLSETKTNTAHVLPVVALAIWLCGFLAVLARWLHSWMRVRTAVRGAEPLSLNFPIRVLSSPAPLEPGVFGIFRPVLLLPAGITRQLAPSHLEAILTHELCHVRRRDNLAAALHMVVEALFWFHPLVWWIGARLIEERERACDEEVVRLGNEPDVYAEGILKACQFYLESPLACVSGVTGSDLKKRVVRIMTQSISVRLDLRKKLLLGSAAALAVALPLAVGLTNASQALSFEVASIKSSKPGTPGPIILFRPGARFEAKGMSTKNLIEQAYNVKDSQLSGSPAWLDSDRYDIEAKPDEATAAALDKIPLEQRMGKFRQMLQSLLAERYKLVLGHETKEMPVYALVVGKNGPKLHESTVGKSALQRGIRITGRGQLTVTDGDIPLLADALSRFVVGRVVLDQTGLTGKYDFTLNWTPESSEGPQMPGGPASPGVDAPPAPESSGPSLFTAIQEQLGLKLESQKAPVDVLVIKHVEKPSEN